MGSSVDQYMDLVVELRLRIERREKQMSKFNPRRMLNASLQQSSGSFRNFFRRKEGSDDIQDEVLCRLHISVDEIAHKCVLNVLERKWSWDVVEAPGQERVTLNRSHSRASRLSEAGTFILDKLAARGLNRSATVRERVRNYSVAEAGTLEMQMFLIPSLSDDEYPMVPIKIADAQDYLSRKVWHATEWHSGHLSQQGGDVKFWRRRFYRVIGARMEACHEMVLRSYAFE